MRLLLIDDDEVDRMMVIRHLRGGKETIEFVQASTGRQGLELFDEQLFDAVLLDFRLPDMGGLEVLAAIQAHPSRRSAVLILTGSADDALELECIAAGAQDFILKNEVSARHLSRALLHARTRYKLESNLRESREALQRLVEKDPLTGISNRYLFDKELKEAIANNKSRKMALLLIDIDNFKLINDSMGHVAGDDLLRNVALRLVQVAGKNKRVYRLGGDEFAIVVPSTKDKASLVKFADSVQAALKFPLQINGYDIGITISIGISIYPDNGATSEEIFKYSDLAMYMAKLDGKDGFHFFTETLRIQAERKAMIERDLRSPSLVDQLELFYQPLIDSSSLKVYGAEALIRWNHPLRGQLAPGEFLDVAEEFGLMRVIDTWSRQTACRQMADWLQAGIVSSSFRMTFNVCAVTLKQADLSAEILRDITALGLPAGSVEMEVTESDLISNFQQSADVLNEIKSYGVDIAVDDFGTGYSSMAYLKHLPASTLKIDRAFLANVPDSEDDCRILRAMIIMGKGLGLHIIVEGIETSGQAQVCRDYGADVLQGFYFSCPLPRTEFEAAYGQTIPSTVL